MEAVKMLVGLHDAEFERMPKKTFPNLALMKISAFHKVQGDAVEWWNGLDNSKYGLVYSSKVFDFTPENPYLPENAVKGGTGYGIYADLPPEIDAMFPDYSIYPNCDYAIGFLTRGCVRNCEWCVVPKKEGKIQPYRTWPEIVRNDTDKLVLMDNNILACKHGISQLAGLSATGYRVDINQGLDIRLLTGGICYILKRLKWLKYIRFSCDCAEQLPYFDRMESLFRERGIPLSKVFIYLLIRKDLCEAERRVRHLYNLNKSFNLYAQAERNEAQGIAPDSLQMEFAQRYVYGRVYKKETWREYCEKRNFKFTEE